MNGSNKLTSDDFMNFFRDDESLNKLSINDRIEIFSSIRLGSSDFKKKLFDEILSDYSIYNLKVIEIK